MAKKPIGLQLWSVRDPAKKDFFGVLRRIADMGYIGAELGGFFGSTAAETRKVMDDLGLVTPALHGDVPNTSNVSQIVDNVRTLGCKYYVTFMGPQNFETVEKFKVAAEKLRNGTALLKPHGIRLLYHSHWWEFELLEGRHIHDMLFEASPDMLCELDVYWTSNFGKVDVPSRIRAQKKVIPLMHIKDGPLVKDAHNLAAGSGKMDIPSCVKAADPKVLEWLIVEFDTCETDIMEAVHKSYKYLTGTGLARGMK